MDVKSEVIEIIDELFMEDVSDMMDEDLFDAGVLDSMGTVELIVELANFWPYNLCLSLGSSSYFFLPSRQKT